MEMYSYEEIKEIESFLDNYNIPYNPKTIYDDHGRIIGHSITLVPFEIETDEIDWDDEEYNSLPTVGEE